LPKENYAPKNRLQNKKIEKIALLLPVNRLFLEPTIHYNRYKQQHSKKIVCCSSRERTHNPAKLYQKNTTTGNQVQQLQRVILTLQKNLSSDSENICDAKKPAVVAVLIKKDNSR
jgi:hypothetical protein